MDRVDTIAITGPELVVYGGCLEPTDTGCAAGVVEGYSWQSGGTRGRFPDLPGAATDLIISMIAVSRYRVYALIDSGVVTAIDFDPWEPENVPVFRDYNDIPARTMALSPDGSVLAVASEDAIWVYDVSVPVDNYADSLWPP
jgi:hypothetical protein